MWFVLLALANPRVVSGIVVGSDGQPLPGIIISALPLRPECGHATQLRCAPPEARVTRSDAHGAYVLQVPEEPGWVVHVLDRAWVGGPRQVPEEGDHPVSLVLRPLGRELRVWGPRPTSYRLVWARTQLTGVFPQLDSLWVPEGAHLEVWGPEVLPASLTVSQTPEVVTASRRALTCRLGDEDHPCLALPRVDLRGATLTREGEVRRVVLAASPSPPPTPAPPWTHSGPPLLHTVPPAPPRAPTEPGQARCVVRVALDADGRLENVDSEDCPEPLRGPVLDALPSWRWQPGPDRRATVGFTF